MHDYCLKGAAGWEGLHLRQLALLLLYAAPRACYNACMDRKGTAALKERDAATPQLLQHLLQASWLLPM